jgi:type VI secretion system secreted protein Hcp
MPIYMQIDGINGSVKTGKYRGWIELQSAQLGAGTHITNPIGNGSDRGAAQPSIREIVITKKTDASSSDLFRASLWGEGKKVKIDFVRDDGSTYLRLELESTLISSFSSYKPGGDAGINGPMDSLRMDFTKISFSNVADKPPETAK